MKYIYKLFSVFFVIHLSFFVEGKQLGVLIDTLDSRVLQGILAKEMCSCVFVDLAESNLSHTLRLKTCLQRGNLPLSETLLKIIMSLRVDPERQRVISDPRLLVDVIGFEHFETATAQFEKDRLGCVLQ